jgi:hypothetical protein
MYSQLLFGELCQILEIKNKHWHRIKTEDDLIGWVRAIQYTVIDENSYQNLRNKSGLSIELFQTILGEDRAIHVVLGSYLPNFDGMACTMPDGKYIYNGLAKPHETVPTTEIFVKVLRKFLYAPELPGGKTPFGIDASALVQVSFRYLNIYLPRFFQDMVSCGDIVDFIELAQKGDIVFFQDNNGELNHVGIYLGEGSIIHVYGCVRIDSVDHHGIYNVDLKKYTHSLRIIKRVISPQNN